MLVSPHIGRTTKLECRTRQVDNGERYLHCGKPLLSAVTVAFNPSLANAPWINAAGKARYFRIAMREYIWMAIVLSKEDSPSCSFLDLPLRRLLLTVE